MPDIETIVDKMQLRCSGHVAHMRDYRIPKQLLLVEFTSRERTVCHPYLRWKDSLKYIQKQSKISATQTQLIVSPGGRLCMTCL